MKIVYSIYLSSYLPPSSLGPQFITTRCQLSYFTQFIFDTSSQVSSSYSTTPHSIFRHLLRTLLLSINYSIWLVYSILPPYLTYFLPTPSGYLLTFPSGQHGLPCKPTILLTSSVHQEGVSHGWLL